MNSGSEKKLSMEELMALNRPEPSPQPTAQESSSPITPIVIQCPLPEALTMLTQKTESIGWEVRGMREYLPILRSHTDLTAVQNSMAKIQKSLTEMTTLLEQAGKKKEKHSCKWLDWLRPDRSGQMDRTGTAHRGGTAGDGVWHSDSGQQHPQPVSMKPLHAGLYGLAVTGALLDDGNEDVEERYRRIQAEQEAKNIGAVIGLVAGVAMVLTQDEQSSTEQQWTEDQQAEQTQQQTM